MIVPEHPKVSIILPVYNAVAVLNDALDSALGQTLAETEVIAVDDGSVDGSALLLQQRADVDPRLRFFQQSGNSGTLAARNRGLRECRGEYVMFLDPDDFLERNAAAELSALADRTHADVIHFGTREFVRKADGGKQPLYNWTNPEKKQLSGKGTVLRDLLRGGHNWSLCFKFVRTEVYRKALSETEELFCIMGEDLYFYLAPAYFAESFLQTGKAYYHYDTTIGITAPRTVSPKTFQRIATLFDALEKSESFLQRHHILKDPVLAAGWENILRGQYLVLWNRWYSCLAPGERGETGEYLLHRAGNKELFLLSIFNENDYLRENQEFLKFACGIYKILNCFFPKNSYMRMKLKTWYKKWKSKREASK